MYLRYNKLGARTLGARSRGSKNVTYIQQTRDKKVNNDNICRQTDTQSSTQILIQRLRHTLILCG